VRWASRCFGCWRRKKLKNYSGPADAIEDRLGALSIVCERTRGWRLFTQVGIISGRSIE
jgi:hypothetical protein